MSDDLAEQLRTMFCVQPALAPQDALDLLAVAAGWKRLAVLGMDGLAWPAALPALLEARGLATATGSGWQIEGALDSLPDWYRDGAAEAARSLKVLYVWQATNPSERPPVQLGATMSEEEEATALAYPSCCVAAFHTRLARLHAIVARQIARRVDGREARLAVLRAGLPPRPANEDERNEMLAATRTRFAPLTPLAMCESCAERDQSPAAALAARYRTLAQSVGWTAPAEAA